MVGVKGFEPPAPCSQSTCATRLRYTPKVYRNNAANVILLKDEVFVKGFLQYYL
jgi:phosphotransferase system IIB component